MKKILLSRWPFPLRSPAALILVGAGVLMATGSVFCADSEAGWPRFLGPHGNNTSRETGLLERWPANGPPLVWEKSVGTGYSAPSVLNGLLVLHHRLGNEEIVEGMDAANGRTKWSFKYSTQFIDPFGYNNGPRSTPLLTSNRCYTFGAEGELTCLNLADGRPIWRRDTAKDWNVPEAFFGVGSTPLLEDGKLIVMVGGQPDSGVVALDPETGKTIWESVGSKTWNGVTPIGWRTTKPYEWTGSEKIASYSSPVAATIHGQRHLLCLVRQGLVSLDPKDGEVRFRRWFQSEINESVNAMTPVVQDDLVLISAAYYRVGAVLLRIEPDGRSFDEVWRSPQTPFERDSRTGSYVAPVLELHWNTPVLHGGFLYAFSGRNEPEASFCCVEFETGRLAWRRDESFAAHSSPQPLVYGRGSAIFADGKLIVFGEGGRLGLFRPNSARPEEVSVWQVPQLHSPCWAGPVLAGKKLYLRSEDRLVCLDLGQRH
jgi:outer membrane protein assembly factor BamB